jgi:serine/threonine protein kinase
MLPNSFKVYDESTKKYTVWTKALYIGKGICSKTYSFHSDTGKEIVCKLIKSKKELFIHQRLTHPNIVKLITHSEQYEGCIIGMEKCHKTLLQEINPFRDKYCKLLDVQTRKNYLSQLNSALMYLKKEGVVHGDLKPDNICIIKQKKSGTDFSKFFRETGSDFLESIKLIDFGFSSFEGDIMSKPRGTPNFICPEIAIVCLTYRRPIPTSYKFDTWAYGCIVYLLCVGIGPFQPEGRDFLTLCNRVVEAEYISMDAIMEDIMNKEEKQLSLLIESVLVKDPKNREEPEDIEKNFFS